MNEKKNGNGMNEEELKKEKDREKRQRRDEKIETDPSTHPY